MNKCSIDICDKPARTRYSYLCEGHWRRCTKGNGLDPEVPFRLKIKGRKCSITGCSKPHKASSYCNGHVLITARAEHKIQLIIEFGGKCNNTDCTSRAEWPKFRREVFDFDHVRGTKKADPKSVITGSWDTIAKEIWKTQLLCKNCHAVKTVENGDNLH